MFDQLILLKNIGLQTFPFEKPEQSFPFYPAFSTLSPNGIYHYKLILVFLYSRKDFWKYILYLSHNRPK